MSTNYLPASNHNGGGITQSICITSSILLPNAYVWFVIESLLAWKCFISVAIPFKTPGKHYI